MKTTINTKPFIRIFIAIVCCLFLLQTAYSQRGDITLTFSGRDAVSGNIVPLQSVMVSNITQGGDTTVWGAAPTLILQETYGIFELNKGQNASFSLEPNFPNPFTGTTTVTVLLQNRQYLKLVLYDQQGAISARLEQEFSRGTHRFEVAVPQNRIYLFSVSDGKASETLKLFSIAGNACRIDYEGPDENTVLKTGTTAFTFQPGDMLEYTANAAGYYEYTTFDTPVENTDYVFDLQANVIELPPTVSTTAVTDITATSASCGGDVTYEGSSEVTARGVCWSISPNPTADNDFTVDGAGLGTYESSITGLIENTTYYVRAYASNQFGTAYGNEVSFTTLVLEPVYVCDSAINYSNQYGTEKVIFTRNSGGQVIKELHKVLNPSYGVWVNYYQVLCIYNTSGNQISYTFMEWNSIVGDWVYVSQSLSTYDVSGNKLSHTHQNWNSNIGSWVNNAQHLYNYDATGNQLSHTYQDWNTNIGSWVNDNRYLYTYDAIGNQLSYTYMEWKSENGTWLNNYQYLYTYDTSGNQLSYTKQEWNINIGSWVNSWQYLYTYDASGNQLSYTYQEWDSNIGTWLNNYQYLNSYDASGNWLSETFQDWNTNIGSWVSYSQYLYTYDVSGNRLSGTYQAWNTNIGTWVNNWQYLYTYDASGNQLSEIFQDWNTNLGSWVNDYQYLYTYDASGNQLSYIYQEWSTSYGTWVNNWKHEYTYDYAKKKITWMYFVWSGGWISEYLNGYVYIFLKNNYLWNGGFCNKIEVWWDEYASSANYKMTLQNLPTAFSPSDLPDGNHSTSGNFEEHPRPDGKDLPGMRERNERPGIYDIENPDLERLGRAIQDHRPLNEAENKYFRSLNK